MGWQLWVVFLKMVANGGKQPTRYSNGLNGWVAWKMGELLHVESPTVG